jgi:hypothetical protein
MDIISFAEAKSAGLKRYFTGTPCSSGHVADRLVSNRSCSECTKIKLAKYRINNREQLLQKKREYAKKQRVERPQHVYAIAKKSVQKNREIRNKEKAVWRKKNSGRVLAWCRKRQLGKKQRTPAWLTDYDKLRIECLYSIAAMLTRHNGEPWHVDHVIPLQGKLVSGLHVPSNLRVMRGVENISKKNKFEVTHG